MIDLIRFRNYYTHKEQFGSFPDAMLLELENRLPPEVIQFLREEGESSYLDCFLRTVLPYDYYSLMVNWGFEKHKMDPKQCHVFLKTSFGGLIFCYENRYYAFCPFLGEFGKLARSFGIFSNYDLTDEEELDQLFWLSHHNKIKHILPKLKENEIYSIAPSIPLGGSPETSRIEIVDMKVHLAILSELYDHKIIRY